MGLATGVLGVPGVRRDGSRYGAGDAGLDGELNPVDVSGGEEIPETLGDEISIFPRGFAWRCFAPSHPRKVQQHHLK